MLGFSRVTNGKMHTELSCERSCKLNTLLALICMNMLATSDLNLKVASICNIYVTIVNGMDCHIKTSQNRSPLKLIRPDQHWLAIPFAKLVLPSETNFGK